MIVMIFAATGKRLSVFPVWFCLIRWVSGLTANSAVVSLFWQFYDFKYLHDFRYDVRALTNRGLRNRVISVRKSWSKDFTLE